MRTLLATYAGAGGRDAGAAAAQPGARPGAGRASSGARRAIERGAAACRRDVDAARRSGTPRASASTCGWRAIALRRVAGRGADDRRGSAAIPSTRSGRRWRSRRRSCAGLGYAGTHFQRAARPRRAATLDAARCGAGTPARRGAGAARPASPSAPKSAARSTWRSTTWSQQAPLRPDAIALPAGGLALRQPSPSTRTSARCAWPASAPARPARCRTTRTRRSCGSSRRTACSAACAPHLSRGRDHAACRGLLLTPERKQPRVLNEAKPYGCIRCGKPFGTLKAIEAMLGKLAGHCDVPGRGAGAAEDVRRLPRRSTSTATAERSQDHGRYEPRPHPGLVGAATRRAGARRDLRPARAALLRRRRGRAAAALRVAPTEAPAPAHSSRSRWRELVGTRARRLTRRAVARRIRRAVRRRRQARGLPLRLALPRAASSTRSRWRVCATTCARWAWRATRRCAKPKTTSPTCAK